MVYAVYGETYYVPMHLRRYKLVGDESPDRTYNFEQDRKIICPFHISKESKMQNVKIINGKTHILPLEVAAKKLAEFGLTVSGFPEALSIPFDTQYPFGVGARNQDASIVIEVLGGYNDLLKLQGMVN